jgi:hypothetical protein
MNQNEGGLTDPTRALAKLVSDVKEVNPTFFLPNWNFLITIGQNKREMPRMRPVKRSLKSRDFFLIYLY